MKKRLRKIWAWIDDRTGITEMISPLLNHPVPPGAKWSYVFGSATLFCFILQIATGIGLALLYQPSSDQAFQSLRFITYQATMGSTLRGIHYFGASAMILLVGVHMLRVYITASYKYPREMNWISGVVLLILTISMGFTGQLLRWDANGVWSSVVAAEQMGRIPLLGKYVAHLLIGGNTIGGQTLTRFFDYHVFLFPSLLFMFIGLHLWLVIRNGISEPPKAGRLVDPKTYRQWYQNLLTKEGIPFWPYAAWRDVLFTTVTIVAIVLLAVLVGPPPVTQPADPAMVYATPQPDWYLLWIYALFALMPPAIESYVMFFGPILVVLFLFSIPFLAHKGERSPLRRPWAMVGVTSVVVIVGSLLVIGFTAPWSPKFNTKMLPSSAIKSNNTEVIAGSVLFYQKGCLYCHRIQNYGGLKGPDLTHVALRLSAQELAIRISNGGAGMPAYGSSLSKDDMNKLLVFLESRK